MNTKKKKYPTSKGSHGIMLDGNCFLFSITNFMSAVTLVSAAIFASEGYLSAILCMSK